jgi:hypothetical protein
MFDHREFGVHNTIALSKKTGLIYDRSWNLSGISAFQRAWCIRQWAAPDADDTRKSRFQHSDKLPQEKPASLSECYTTNPTPLREYYLNSLLLDARAINILSYESQTVIKIV